MENIKKRNRCNEVEVYTREVLQRMNERYQKMLEMDLFKQAKMKGNLRLISYDWRE